ncbi:GTP cyclohydrolase 1 type 2/Nif3 [Mycena amicta]|nr:GTP cyclohydrolase 1 type 2/Nif3 [Mycena amicta]
MSLLTTRYKLVFFVPTTKTRAVLDHLFAKFPDNVGKIGNYEKVAFLSRGTGQFQPSLGANPAIGTVGEMESVEEDRVEVVVRDQVNEVVQELKKVHPYEQVAYDVYKLEDI